jgi:hypothetical protein
MSGTAAVRWAKVGNFPFNHISACRDGIEAILAMQPGSRKIKVAVGLGKKVKELEGGTHWE